MNAVQMMDERMIKALRKLLAEAEAKGKKAEARKLAARLSEWEEAARCNT